jgi:23S rRNA pseudouridine2457 synthase
MLLAFHKPFGVVSQFTPDGSKHRTLADFGFPKDVYPIGRLDAESEGMVGYLIEQELGLGHGGAECWQSWDVGESC